MVITQKRVGYHKCISHIPSSSMSLDSRDLFVLGLGQLRLNLDPFSLLAHSFGIAFPLQFLSSPPLFLHPYPFLELVSFLGANQTKSASVGPRLFMGAI